MFLLIASLGCDAAPPVAGGTTPQWYRAHVTTAGAQVPFFLRLPSDCDADDAIIANGDERIPVRCRRSGERLVLDFPVYGTSITAEGDPAGTLSGHWRRGDGTRAPVPFEATPVQTRVPSRRFAFPSVDGDPAPPAIDLSGVWRIEFDTLGPARGVFEQTDGGVVRGTADVPSEYGDLRFLAGTLRGAALSLSRFDGQSAALIEAQLEPGGTIRGTFSCCDEPRDMFVAERSEGFNVVDPLQQVRVTSTETRLDFAPLLTPPYDGKAVIVEIFGTWCPNCNDLAPLLAELYRDHHDEGLEMLAVAYELSDSAAYNQERLAAYRAKYGLAWEIITADVPPDDLFAVGPAALSPIEGVPVTIFLNRDRTIRAVYAGFRGPATGAAHDEATAIFRELTSQILEQGQGAR